MGRLDVRIVEARNLPNKQAVGTIDPYVKVRLGNAATHSTTVKEDQVSPTWNEVFKFVVADADSAQLIVEVWNSNVTSDDFLGEYKLSLSGLFKGQVKDEWYLLQQCASNAEIHIRLLAVDFGLEPVAPTNDPAIPIQQPPSPPQQAPSMPPPQQGYHQSPPQQGYNTPPAQGYNNTPPQQGAWQQPPPSQCAPAPVPEYHQPPPQSQYPQAQVSPYNVPASYGAPAQGQPVQGNPQWGAPPPQQSQPQAVQPVAGKPVGPSRTGLSGFLNKVVDTAGSALDSVQRTVNSSVGIKRQSLFQNVADGYVFLLMDNYLRHIPNQQVFTALFNRQMDTESMGKFNTNTNTPPAPAPFGEPLPDFTRIIVFNGEFYLVDSQRGMSVRRHLNKGAWNNIGLIASGNIKTVQMDEFNNIPHGTPIVN